jgi:hypothetical protein
LVVASGKYQSEPGPKGNPTLSAIFAIIINMKAKPLTIILIVLGLLIISSLAFVIIWAGRNNPEAKKQTSLKSCSEFGKSIVGLSEEDAVNMIKQDNRVYRVAQRDSENYPLTMDFSPDRINLFIEKGKVISFDCN